MENNVVIEARKVLRVLNELLLQKNKRARILDGYEKVTLVVDRNRKGTEYYRVRNRRTSASKKSTNKKNLCRSRYLGKASEAEVKKIKEAHHLEVSKSVINHNIQLMEYVIKEFQAFDDISINEKLTKAYRIDELSVSDDNKDPRAVAWKEEMLRMKARFKVPYEDGLIHRAQDGTLVRSKSEVIIYNFLLSLGITFVYEVPIVTENGTLWPDFTILCETDYETVIMIEHQGMMDDEAYRLRVGKRIHDYVTAGYKPNKDVFFTFDSKDNGLDLGIFQEILRLRVRPTL